MKSASSPPEQKTTTTEAWLDGEIDVDLMRAAIDGTRSEIRDECQRATAAIFRGIKYGAWITRAQLRKLGALRDELVQLAYLESLISGRR
jgi:hypothetical protein